jgi:hypothetical protein
VQALWRGKENIIKEKVVASPSPSRDESCESVFAHGLPVHQKCSNYASTNFLFGFHSHKQEDRKEFIFVYCKCKKNLKMKINEHRKKRCKKTMDFEGNSLTLKLYSPL